MATVRAARERSAATLGQVPLGVEPARDATIPFMRFVASAVLLVVAGAAIGCSGAGREDIVCAPYIATGLSVTVVNSQSSVPICDARVTARDGSYTETLGPGVTCSYQGAIERAGTYSVSAERSGFAGALTSDVRVVSTGGDCPHVRTAAVTLRLVPAE